MNLETAIQRHAEWEKLSREYLLYAEGCPGRPMSEYQWVKNMLIDERLKRQPEEVRP